MQCGISDVVVQTVGSTGGYMNNLLLPHPHVYLGEWEPIVGLCPLCGRVEMERRLWEVEGEMACYNYRCGKCNGEGLVGEDSWDG